MINPGLDHVIKDIRMGGLAKAKKDARTVSWRERDYLDGTVDAGVVIVPTKGCAWGLRSGCSMCGYVYDSMGRTDEAALLKGLEEALAKVGDVPYLKIFNSGSFFDEREVSPGLRKEIMELINAAGADRLQVESRPEFIKSDILSDTTDMLDAELEVGIGLETASDYIRANCVNKGFTRKDFEKASANCRDAGVLVKAYLLIKPPFLTEREALEDMVASAVKAEEMGASRVSFNPMNIQRGTLVERLWKKGEYRPPWLWNVIEILKRTSERLDVPVLCHPTAAGKARGAHNCGECDGDITRGIMEFSVTQDMKHLEGFDCRCKGQWEDTLELEGYGQTPDGRVWG